MLLALALATASSAVPHHRAARIRAALRPSACATAACTAEPPRSRYRLDAPDEVPRDTKQTALATDGSACSIVGARVCTRKPRTIVTTHFPD